jgi:hypothetical protein
MNDRIKKHLEEREAINIKLEAIMGHCNDSPINTLWLDMQWGIYKDALHLQVGDDEAKVIAAKGTSEAEAEKAKQLASVIAQTELAKEIGENHVGFYFLNKNKKTELDG